LRNYCGEEVPFSERRKGHKGAENRNHDCKCPKDMKLTGASRICYSSNSEGHRKFSGTELKDAGCYCRPESKTLEPQDVVLLGMLKSKNMKLQEYVLERIEELIGSPSARLRARRMGFIRNVTEFLGSNRKEELETKAVRALANVIQGSSESVNEACEAKAAVYLGKLLEKKKRNDLDDDTAIAILNIMQLFVEATEEGKKAVLNARAVDAIFYMLDAEEKVAREAVGVLEAIASTKEVGASNTFVMEKLADTLQNDGASAFAKGRAVKLLDSLALENADALSNIRTEGKIIGALVDTFTQKIKGLDESESFVAMTALSKMAGGELGAPNELQDRRKATIIKSDGVLRRLLNIIDTPDALEMGQEANKLFKLLASFMAGDVIDELMQILSDNRAQGHKLILQVSAMRFENIKRGLKERLLNKLRELQTLQRYDGVDEESALLSEDIEKLLQEI